MADLAERIKEALDAFWDERAIPCDSGEASTLDDLVGPVESMTAVDVLVTLDTITGLKIPNTVIQAGGYQTKDEFITKLTAAVLDYVASKQTP
ncbi:hypothetical protein [Variovorax sp. E3]|uniref:hypothetical protein n=1 Tax=Variovorax sp. E3 TaxID=1914993 RepID=UPI0018DBAA26|nr:hypothetical protein [Variovorax sp. E3]